MPLETKPEISWVSHGIAADTFQKTNHGRCPCGVCHIALHDFDHLRVEHRIEEMGQGEILADRRLPSASKVARVTEEVLVVSSPVNPASLRAR